MRSIIAVLALFFSVNALTTTYTGKGLWKSTDGESGDYSVVANVQVNDDDTVSLSQTLTWAQGTMSFDVTLKKVDETFYDVIDTATNETIGWGYCWPLEGNEGGKICHSSSYQNDTLVESTIKKTKTDIYRMGSVIDLNDNTSITWKDWLQQETVEE